MTQVSCFDSVTADFISSTLLKIVGSVGLGLGYIYIHRGNMYNTYRCIHTNITLIYLYCGRRMRPMVCYKNFMNLSEYPLVMGIP